MPDATWPIIAMAHLILISEVPWTPRSIQNTQTFVLAALLTSQNPIRLLSPPHRSPINVLPRHWSPSPSFHQFLPLPPLTALPRFRPTAIGRRRAIRAGLALLPALAHSPPECPLPRMASLELCGRHCPACVLRICRLFLLCSQLSGTFAPQKWRSANGTGRTE